MGISIQGSIFKLSSTKQPDPADLGSCSLFPRFILPSFVCHLRRSLSHRDKMLLGLRVVSS